MRKNVEEKMVKQEVITWVANDGTVFKDEAECLKYEETARGVINGAFMNIKKKSETNAECISEATGGVGYDDIIYAVEIDSEQTLKDVNMWLKFNGVDKVFSSDKIGTVQLIDKYDGDIWLMGSIGEYKERFCKAIDSLIDWNKDEKEEVK